MSASCTLTSHGVEWGGSDRIEHNIFAWFWAIADSSIDSVTHEDVAMALAMLGRDRTEAPVVLAKARRILAANALQNRRTGAWQRYLSMKKADLLAQARRMGLRVSGFDTKQELTEALVEANYPRPKPEDFE